MRIHRDIFEAISKLTPGPYQNQIPGAIPQYGIDEAAGAPGSRKRHTALVDPGSAASKDARDSEGSRQPMRMCCSECVGYIWMCTYGTGIPWSS